MLLSYRDSPDDLDVIADGRIRPVIHARPGQMPHYPEPNAARRNLTDISMLNPSKRPGLEGYDLYKANSGNYTHFSMIAHHANPDNGFTGLAFYQPVNRSLVLIFPGIDPTDIKQYEAVGATLQGKENPQTRELPLFLPTLPHR